VPDAPFFEMDVSRLGAELGPPAGNLHDRLRELAAQARRESTAFKTSGDHHA
jgi:hypothetical protein